VRRLFATALIALLVGVGIVVVIETDPGYVLVAYGKYTLESSLWIGLLVLLLLVLLIFLLLRLLYRIVGGRRSLFSWLDARKVRNAQRLTTLGLISLTEGNWLTARRQLVRGAQFNEAPLVNYLLAARASAQLKDADKADEYLRAAGDAEPEAELAVKIAQAEMKLQAGEYDQVIALLDHSTRNFSRHPHVLGLLHQAYLGLRDWDKMLELLPQLQKHKLLDTGALQQLEREIHTKQLERDGTSREQLRASWQKVPKALQRDVALVEAHVRSLVRLGDHDAAEDVLLRALRADWQGVLVRQLGFVQTSDAQRQLARAESMLAAHPDDACFLLCLGRLSMRAKLWGKARDYFESSYRLEHSAEVCAELGRLLTGLGESSVAAAYFREGLLLREDALPALPMPEKLVPDALLLAKL
jgi:HemY protein